MTYNGEADNINTLNHDILIIFFTEKNEKKNSDSMDEKNYTTVKEFILLGFTTDSWLQSSLLYLPHHIYQQSFREHHPDFSDLC